MDKIELIFFNKITVNNIYFFYFSEKITLTVIQLN